MAIGSSIVVVVQYFSITSSAGNLWQRSQTKCPFTQSVEVSCTSLQYTHFARFGISRYVSSFPQTIQPLDFSMHTPLILVLSMF